MHFRAALLLVLGSLMLSYGCRPGSRRAPGTIDESESGEILQRLESAKQVYHLCPSPAEMLGVIDATHLIFNGDLLNPVSSAERYLDAKSTTMALGVYASDMAYAALFGRHEETLDYLEVIRSMADRIRVTGAVDDEMIRNAKANVDNLDSLFDISNEAFISMLFFCERNDRPGTIVLLSAGAFIESLYLAVNLVDRYEDAGYLMQHLTDQKYALENLVIFAESLGEGDEDPGSVIGDLQPLIRIYEGLQAGNAGPAVVARTIAGEGKPGKLVIGSSPGTAPIMNAREFEQLREETIRLRTRLVEGLIQ